VTGLSRIGPGPQSQDSQQLGFHDAATTAAPVLAWHNGPKGESPMEKRIGIIGAGIAGLHLGLYLRQHGIGVTIVSDRTAEQITKSRLPNTAAHFAVTIDREKMLSVDHWSNPEFQYTCHNHSFGGGPQRLEFRGDFVRPSRAIDHRLYLPKLMNDFEAPAGQSR
jgi:hypothetical protein